MEYNRVAVVLRSLAMQLFVGKEPLSGDGFTQLLYMLAQSKRENE